MTGWTRLARRAGSQAASSAAAARTSGTPTNVSGSERVDLEQQPAQQACRDEREDQPERAAGDHQSEAARDEQPHDARPVGAERHADADLLRPLRDAVADHAVEADGGQRQRQHPEGGQDEGGEPLREPHQRQVAVHRPRLEDPQVGVHLAPGAQERERRPLRVGRRPRHDRQGAREPLRVGEVDQVARRLAESPHLRVGGHADDQPGGIVVVGPADQAADRVAVLPEAPGHRLADDDDGLRVRPVGVAEVAAADDLDARRLEEPGVDLGPVRDEGAAVARRLEARHVEVARPGAQRIQVQAADRPDRRDAGQLAEAVEQAPGVDARLVRREAGGRRQEGQEGGRLAAEAGVDRLHLLEAAQEEAGPDEQHQRDRELGDDQGVAPAELPGLPAPRALAAEGAGDVRPRALEGRHQAQQGAGHEGETPSVNARTRPSRRRSSVTGIGSGRSTVASRWSSQTASPVPAPPASRPSSVVSVRSRRTRDPRDAPRARRTAISLRRSRARASRKLARLVHASSSTSATTAVSNHAAARMKTSMGGKNSTSVRGRSANCPAGSQFSMRSRVSCAATAPTAASASGSATPGRSRALTNRAWFPRLSNVRTPTSCSHHRIGCIERRREAAHRAREVGRPHPDHGVRPAAGAHLPPHDVRIAGEGGLPVAVVEHHHRVPAARDVVARQQGAPEGGLDPQHREVVAGHRLRRHDADPSALGAVDVRRRELRGADVAEHLGGAVPDVLEVRVGERAVGERRLVEVEVDHLFRPLDRRVAQEDGVDEAEDGRVGADPERERDDGDRRERRPPGQRPDAVAHVAAETVDAPHDGAALPDCDVERDDGSRPFEVPRNGVHSGGPRCTITRSRAGRPSCRP